MIFQKPPRGIGAVYLGPLRDEYFILVGNAKTGIKYTIENGELLAQNYADGIDESRFFEVLSKRTVGATDLDELADFCPCAIHSGHRDGAQQSLIKLLLEDRCVVGIARKTTFRLLMEFLRIGAGVPSVDPVKDFLDSCYAEAIGSECWVLSEALAPTRSKWALYARNEMMSLAWYTFFKLALDELDGQPSGARTRMRH